MIERAEDLFDKAPYEEEGEAVGLDEDAIEAQALADWEAEQVGDPTRNRINEAVFLGLNTLKKKQ